MVIFREKYFIEDKKERFFFLIIPLHTSSSHVNKKASIAYCWENGDEPVQN